ncbi:MAG: protein bugT-like protein [Betaproteobacteria bacterium]|nr:protein bugT-like protein [Betaproteobacteria bacterium]
MKARAVLSIALLALQVATAAAFAQAGRYPTKVVRWVVPFAAGGGTDVVARPIALAMGEAMGQPVAYDNRGGGNGLIAGEIVARAAPDGYTLLVGSPAIMTANQHLYAKMPFDPLRDFVAIAKFANVPNLLIANPSLPSRTLPELIDYAKSNPGKVNWASSGIGSGGHLAIELVQIKTGIKVLHIVYKGAGPALIAVIGGDAQLMFGGPGVFMPHLKAGRVRALAIGSLQRIPILPEVPTLNESGLAGMQTGSWYGLVAPAGTPPAIIKTIHATTVKILNMSDIAARLTADGAIVSGNSPEQFAQEIRDEAAMWGRVIKQAGIKLD